MLAEILDKYQFDFYYLRDRNIYICQQWVYKSVAGRAYVVAVTLKIYIYGNTTLLLELDSLKYMCT